MSEEEDKYLHGVKMQADLLVLREKYSDLQTKFVRLERNTYPKNEVDKLLHAINNGTTIKAALDTLNDLRKAMNRQRIK